MASIETRMTQTGTAVYRVKIRRKGLPLRSATFADVHTATQWAQTMETQLLAARDLPPGRRYTLAQAIDRYQRDILPQKSRSSQVMQTLQLRWWHDQVGAKPLAEITPALVTAYREHLIRTEADRPRANATVNRYLAALSHVFSVAKREWEWTDDNPVQRVRGLKEPRGRVRFLRDDERHRLLDTCRQSPHPYLYTIVILALSTGARKGELLHLTWLAVDLHRRRLILEDTKNGEWRAVPLVGHAHELVAQLVRERCPETSWLFPRPDGYKPWGIAYAWQRALQQADVQDFRFHDLRHSAASYLAMNHATLAEIAMVLGHKTLDMVRRYAHLTDSHIEGVVRGMNERMFADMGSE